MHDREVIANGRRAEVEADRIKVEPPLGRAAGMTVAAGFSDQRFQRCRKGFRTGGSHREHQGRCGHAPTRAL